MFKIQYLLLDLLKIAKWLSSLERDSACSKSRVLVFYTGSSQPGHSFTLEVGAKLEYEAVILIEN